MDPEWIGRKLAKASEALTDRYRDLTARNEAASSLVAAIAPKLLVEIGRSLCVGDTDARRPFQRWNGTLRLPTNVEETDVVHAWNALAALVSSYVRALPGVTGTIDRFARDAVRHAAHATIQLHRELRLGLRRPASERQLRGVAVLSFPAQPVTQAS